jgi:transcriptional regulator of arginine metabolism
VKNKRQAIILDIIKKKGIRTQKEILTELQKVGIKTTQATISRDLDELEINKMASEYTSNNTEQPEGGVDLLNKALSDFAKSVTHTNNLVLIKTLSGGAQGIASVIDTISWNGILGTVAGDDTILIVAASKASGKRIAQRLKQMMQ